MEGQTTPIPEFGSPDNAAEADSSVEDRTNVLEFNSTDTLSKELLNAADPGLQFETIFIATERGHMKTMRGPFTPQKTIEIVQQYQKRTGSRVNDIVLDFMR